MRRTHRRDLQVHRGTPIRNPGLDFPIVEATRQDVRFRRNSPEDQDPFAGRLWTKTGEEGSALRFPVAKLSAQKSKMALGLVKGYLVPHATG